MNKDKLNIKFKNLIDILVILSVKKKYKQNA